MSPPGFAQSGIAFQALIRALMPSMPLLINPSMPLTTFPIIVRIKPTDLPTPSIAFFKANSKNGTRYLTPNCHSALNASSLSSKAFLIGAKALSLASIINGINLFVT